MRRLLLLLLFPLLLPQAALAAAPLPPDARLVFDVSLTAARGVAVAAHAAAVEERDFAGCAVTAVLDTTFTQARGWLTVPTSGLPAFHASIAECLPFAPRRLTPQVQQDAVAAAEATASTILATLEGIAAGAKAAGPIGCTVIETAAAIVGFILDAIQEVLRELAAPDGVITIPARTIGSCVPEPPPTPTLPS